MTPIVVPNNQCSMFRLAGRDDTEVDRTVTGSLTMDDVTHGYVAKMPPVMGGNQYIVVSRGSTLAPGQSVNINVTVNCADDRGTLLPPFVMPFTLIGPPLPPAATHMVISEGPFGRDKIGFTPPIDPGSGTIPL